MAKACILMIFFCGFLLEPIEITQIVRLVAIIYILSYKVPVTIC